MVFQQKVGSATKNKIKKNVQCPKPSMFELDANDNDSEDMDSDDFAESSDEEMDSDDVQEPPKTSNRKIPQAKTPSKQTPGKQTPAKQTPGKQTPAKQTPGKQTPAKQTPGKQTPAKQTPGKQNLAKQTPGKQTPNKKNSLVLDKKVSFELATAKTPTATDSQVGKRQATPASKGKQSVQEFKGLKAGLKHKSQTSLKMNEEDSDEEEEDDDDDDEDCDEEDDSKQNVIKSKLKQKIGKNQNNDEEEDDEEEDDDDEEEEDDDDKEEEEEDEEEEDEDDDEDDSKQNVLKNTSKQKIDDQNSQQVRNKTALKKEASSPTQTDDSLTKKNEKNLAIGQKNKEIEDLRDARQLMIRNLPNDITCEEIKSLSDDVINVSLPDPDIIKQKHFKTVFSFVQFASEEKAEKNYAAFQNQKLRGVAVECDYSGVKSKTPKRKDFAHTSYDTKKLHVSNLPTDVKVIQIAQLTPSATSIFVTASLNRHRTAFVNFATEEEAAEAFEANKEAEIDGKPVIFLYALERKFESRQPFKRGFQQGGRPPFAKRPRQDLDASSQD